MPLDPAGIARFLSLFFALFLVAISLVMGGAHAAPPPPPNPEEEPAPVADCNSSLMCAGDLVCSVEQGACLKNPECADGGLCTDECWGQCLPPQDAAPSECEDIADCGACALGCNEFGECEYGGSDECEVAADCGAGATCDTTGPCGSVCVNATAPVCDKPNCFEPCSYTEMCGDGLVCSVEYGACLQNPECADEGNCTNECWGQCVLPTEQESECPITAGECTEDSECAEGQICTANACGGICEDVQPECVQDADCGDCFAICSQGTCQYTGIPECETAADCGLGFICDHSICEGTCMESFPPQCVDVSDCGECALGCSEFGECQYGGDDECEVDADCGAGGTCDKSGPCGTVCVAGPGGDPQCQESQCAEDSDCATDEVCVVDDCGGLCVYNQSECTEVADCGECALACSEFGECQYGGDDECEVDADCGGGETCFTSGPCGNLCVVVQSEELPPIPPNDDADGGCSSTGGGAGAPAAFLLALVALWAGRRRHFIRPPA